jgi:YesN/AraC family two-component response regulator
MYQVLIVDDEAVVVKGLTASIDWESLNLNVALATSDVNEAVTYIEQRPVDLLITDVCMPDMTGLELISYARNRQPAIRSIVISAHDKFSYVKEALKNGAENYLLKPVDKTELTETIIKTIENLNQEELGSLIDVSNRMAFRSNVLDRWTRNSIDEADLAERASFLDIDIDQSCWSVVLIQPQTMNTSLVHALQLVKIMQNLGEQPYTSQYFINGSFTVVGILSNFNAENQEHEHRSVLLSQLDILRTEAAGRQIEYAVSIGESGGKYTDIPFSFSQASRYLPVADCWIHHCFAATSRQEARRKLS